MSLERQVGLGIERRVEELGSEGESGEKTTKQFCQSDKMPNGGGS